MKKITDLLSLLALGAAVSPARILAAHGRARHHSVSRRDPATASVPALVQGRRRPRRLGSRHPAAPPASEGSRPGALAECSRARA